MNYNELLSLGAKNAQHSTLQLKRLRTINQNQGPDSRAVALFKQRKEQEEMKRVMMARREKERLLAMRSQNTKLTKAAKMMATRTKENDFSKIILSDNDIARHNIVNDQIQKKGLVDKKARMKERIDLESKIEGLDRKKANRVVKKIAQEEPVRVASTNRLKIQEIIKQSQKKSEETKPIMKQKKPPPPIHSYEDILNIASKNSSQKMTLEQEIMEQIRINQEQKAQEMKALAEKQKEQEIHREEQYFRSKMKEKKTKQVISNDNEISSLSVTSSSRFPKSSTIPQRDLNLSNKITKSSKSISATLSNGNRVQSQNAQTSNHSNQCKSSLPSVMQERKTCNTTNKSSFVIQNGRTSNLMNQRSEMKPKLSQASSKTNLASKAFASSSNAVVRNNPFQMSKSRPAVHSVTRKISPPSRPKLPPIGATYRRNDYREAYYENEDYYSDEDEYDDEMADFIDDGPQDGVDNEVSKAIREIFKYDKRKYRNINDDDDDNMEASFSQCMKEEAHSLRAGIQEDLEDIRREEEEKKMKALVKRARQKNLKGY